MQSAQFGGMLSESVHGTFLNISSGQKGQTGQLGHYYLFKLTKAYTERDYALKHHLRINGRIRIPFITGGVQWGGS